MWLSSPAWRGGRGTWGFRAAQRPHTCARCICLRLGRVGVPCLALLRPHCALAILAIVVATAVRTVGCCLPHRMSRLVLGGHFAKDLIWAVVVYTCCLLKTLQEGDGLQVRPRVWGAIALRPRASAGLGSGNCATLQGRNHSTVSLGPGAHPATDGRTRGRAA